MCGGWPLLIPGFYTPGARGEAERAVAEILAQPLLERDALILRQLGAIAGRRAGAEREGVPVLLERSEAHLDLDRRHRSCRPACFRAQRAQACRRAEREAPGLAEVGGAGIERDRRVPERADQRHAAARIVPDVERHHAARLR